MAWLCLTRCWIWHLYSYLLCCGKHVGHLQNRHPPPVHRRVVYCNSNCTQYVPNEAKEAPFPGIYFESVARST
ncbi:hypothetical protein GALMADRAFT_253753 [Galerina marginata CBS 339.88]|uniref:Secreted protein n=1 Tax=Galerina marginata (strain CBS 339.88) TaxID=685588 RepID=A0A067SN79_GALM3|nr:hypothetical protein GALMADRAFT_253753 [Galerina marginata CBS 339.88]